MLLCIQLSGHAQQKRALIICVGEQEDKSWEDINAENDLRYVIDVLDYYRYGDVVTLEGKQATKSNIVAAFRSLSSRCRQDDIVYVHFSGHGQRMTDVDGDEVVRRAKDKYDESWIPYDAYLEYGSNDKGDRHLSDDEIAVLLRDVKKKIGVNGEILVVVDACHSGGSTRGREDDADNFCIRGVENFFVIPEASLTSIGTHQESAVQKEEWLTLSACTDYQSNTECSLPVVGRLTYALYQLKRRLGAMSNEELIRAVKGKINSYSPALDMEQTPILSDYKCDISRFFQR